MSGSVTPARRPREEDESEIEDFEPSIDGEASPRPSTNKRPRLSSGSEDDEADREDDEHEQSDLDEDNLLPDSYRRSPKTNGRAVDMLHTAQPTPEHKPGSIVRVTLVNFVTYTKAEFHPGPNLNMIIGPNGTGKSTLVCAICLGLGWSTNVLGRAKDLGEFVKHGTKRAEIEIELARDPTRQEENPIITTRITKDGNKSEYTLNRKKANKKAVQELARSFSIQVDNLCQFLPQDRVVEFSALSPEELLSETQRAAAPEYMTEWHHSLKEMRKSQKAKQSEQQSLMESVKQDENRQRLQEADVTRMRERGELQQRKAILEKLRPFPQYAVAQKEHLEAKARKKQAEKELRRLQHNAEPNLRAEEAKKAYHESVEKWAGSRERMVNRLEKDAADLKKKIGQVEEEIEGCAAEIQTEKQNSSKERQLRDKQRRDIESIKKSEEVPPPAFDSVQMNADIRERASQMRVLQGKVEELKEKMQSIKAQIAQRQEIIASCETERNDLQSQAGQQSNKLGRVSKDAATAWKWITNNRDKFEGEVFGPPIIECSVKNPKYASAVENTIPVGEQLAFTVTCQNDFHMLNQQIYQVMKLNNVNIRSSPNPLSSFRPLTTQEELQRYGFECWILDLLEGPEEVLAMLCDNARIHQTAFTSKDISNQQYDALQRTSFSTWVTEKETYQIVRRREYGSQAVNTKVQLLKPAQNFTDAPVDRQREQEIAARKREAEGERAELYEEYKALREEGPQLQQRHDELMKEKEDLEAEKNAKQAQHAAYNALPARRQRSEEKLAGLLESLRGADEREQAIIDRADALTIDMGQRALNYANSIESLRKHNIEFLEARILQIEAKSDLDQLQAKHAEELQMLDDRTAEVAELQRIQKGLLAEGARLGAICRDVGDTFTEDEEEVYNEIMETRWSSDQLETEIQSVQARMEMTHGGGNQNTLREFEERANRIELKKAKLADLETTLKDLFEKIEEMRLQWEPELDQLVGQISEAFAENFSRIDCVGEVAVHKDDDFELWSIQIKVKFRQTEQLSILDSHRQSGGERAVSTIFYLMALQSLARAPFRVVDEINQGMDPRNERMVHSRMVDIACDEHTSQYFLITPKLLPGLRYHPNMKVHCIASGEYMPEDHRELDFGALAKKALAVRGVEAAG